MDYLVIELKDEPHIICKCNMTSDGKHIKNPADRFNSGGIPVIFKDKNSAFRISGECKQGLVYPIIDIMKVLDQITALTKRVKRRLDSSNDYTWEVKQSEALLDELLAITDEII